MSLVASILFALLSLVGAAITYNLYRPLRYRGGLLLGLSFFGGWLGPWLPPVVWLLLKTFVLIAFFVLCRATLPRPRFDQLTGYAWKWLLPLTLVNLAVTGAIRLALEGP